MLTHCLSDKCTFWRRNGEYAKKCLRIRDGSLPAAQRTRDRSVLVAHATQSIVPLWHSFDETKEHILGMVIFSSFGRIFFEFSKNGSWNVSNG